MTRHPGGRPPVRGSPQRIRKQLKLTEAEWAEISACIPDGEPEGPWIIEAALRRARTGG